MELLRIKIDLNVLESEHAVERQGGVKVTLLDMSRDVPNSLDHEDMLKLIESQIAH